MEFTVVSNEVVSAGKNVGSTHVEISTMERFRMREGKKERGAPSCQDRVDPQSFHDLVYFYTGARAWALPARSYRLSFSFLGDLPCSLDWLDYLACYYYYYY